MVLPSAATARPATQPADVRRGLFRRRRATARLAVVLTAALGAGLLAGCSPDDADATASNGKKKVTLSVGVFGVFGYKQAGLYDEYEKQNPHIKIKENSTERNEDYYPALLNRLSAGSGLADIQAVEVSNINELATLLPAKFVDMAKAEGVDQDGYLPWKWDQAKAADGRVIGLGTDIGPMGVCYRKDLFAKAGLPTDRAEVGKLWAGDWAKYVDVGARYTAKAPKGTSFMDGATGLYNGSVSSYAEKNYAADGTLVYKKSEAVRTSWDLAMRAVEGKMTGRLKQFDTAWDQGYANGTFATVVCPSWMLGYIKEKAGEKNAGQWDVAAAPRPANWGGSFLTVPEASRNKDEAVKLATWLTAPKQQARLFRKQASFPSSSRALELPEVADATHEYFAAAPIGRIFSDAAKGIPTAILGPKDQIIGQNLADVGILQVEQQGRSPKDAWNAAVKKIDDALAD
ncbi:ABC transporter substrate-binding protein [Streptomyces alkaliterrae]|uniref:Extracellular solute-binding protein n=1 Tax=Streptomyces alkaliterrae TaxID=2213162 RepID=A0A5P0YWJ5_9ACTN|nr:extracellular solute-binding protein [Streptomyces alkaliterrae]MBB1255042.1 extracellular solute-binding protein [Streptomyces alkaliterrae]MBB1260353.1 extracellular solute-binding protein [Streptomyces alkaliterrae]MQS03862.1 extracellular solute-binding protein [Streptomyces alkaliterrae]